MGEPVGPAAPEGVVSDAALAPEAGGAEQTSDDASRRPSPVLLALLAVVLIGFVAWKFVLNKESAEPVAPAPVASTPSAAAPSAAAAANATSWADAVPKSRAGGDTDANSLDAREVAPARFAHQVELAREALKPGEDLFALRVQSDGTLVALAGDGTTARWVATKKDLAPTAPGGAMVNLKPLTPADIQDRVPLKLLRAAQRAGGVAPTELYLAHGGVAPGTVSALFGDVPTWTFKWTGLDAPAATVVATADGHTLKAFTN